MKHRRLLDIFSFKILHFSNESFFFRFSKTILGHGMDCHLLGLREFALENGLPMPKIFEHESFRISNHFSLSTSQVILPS